MTRNEICECGQPMDNHPLDNHTPVEMTELRRLGASGVDVEGLAATIWNVGWERECNEQSAMSKEQLAELIRKRIAPQWISVKERLPKYGEMVVMWFVTVDPRNSGVVLGSRSIHEPGKYWDHGGLYRDFACVSHWQPLPAPPEAEQEESNG